MTTPITRAADQQNVMAVLEGRKMFWICDGCFPDEEIEDEK